MSLGYLSAASAFASKLVVIRQTWVSSTLPDAAGNGDWFPEPLEPGRVIMLPSWPDVTSGWLRFPGKGGDVYVRAADVRVADAAAGLGTGTKVAIAGAVLAVAYLLVTR